MKIPQADIDILCGLAEEQARIADLPVHREKAELWQRVNDRQPARPAVWINEICWNEMDVDGELALHCQHPWARQQEQGLRRLLYQWHHLPVDSIVDPYIACPLIFHSTGFGVTPQEETLRSDAAAEVVSHRYLPQFRTEKDIEKIQTPQIRYDRNATEEQYDLLCEVYDSILPVRKVGIKSLWFAPWDRLVELWGVEQAMTDLIDRPELVNAAMERFVDAHLAMLDQYEALGLLSFNHDNSRIGSGGYGYTQDLPGSRSRGETSRGSHVHPYQTWGCATAQIFSDVSPAMHWEFALRHEMRWLQRWGLTYYGCCEPLDRKIEILRRIPNLRKISLSPWNHVERFIRKTGGEYVLSRKPNPAILARDTWQPEEARRELVEFLTQARGHSIEIILKDISTVRYQPQRLWEWARMAVEVAEQFA